MLNLSGHWLKLSLAFIIVCSGCVTIARMDLDDRFGQSNVAHRQAQQADEDSLSNSDDYYLTQVKPIIESRCVVCHACYDAPCQLKMSSSEGIERGANKQVVYNGARLVAEQPNRLFIDAHDVNQWRERDFFPVLNEREQTKVANTQASVLAQMLVLKQQHPLPEGTHLDERFDVSLNRENQCPSIEEFGDYAQSNSIAGMPYGLPGLSNKEHQHMMSWLEKGANMPGPQLPSAAHQQAVSRLEDFLNADSLNMRLSARYIYEHLFTSHLYFSELTDGKSQPQFYRVVRSRTPSGEPISVIATRRPFDDPQFARVYYRLVPVTATIVNKTHQPYAINDQLMSKWQRWFVDAQYQVESLPGYAPEVAANPLTAFAQLPVNARYRFMLERAENTIMGYIKGPVCRGQIALNVINDRFWVMFLDPELANSPKVESFYLSQRDNLRMPAQQQSTTTAIEWPAYAARQSEYLKARNQFLNKTLKNGEHLTIDALWDGDGDNQNASLTVFRHFDNATVVKGLVGEPPKTAWIIDYALLERIHYLLVAGFDVYGNYGHQLMTRLYMDFLRLEGESNFVALLPQDSRSEEFTSWYKQAGPELSDFFEGYKQRLEQPSGIQYQTQDHKAELFELIRDYFEDLQPSDYAIKHSELGLKSIETLDELNGIEGENAAIFPEITMIMIESPNTDQVEIFTLLRNSAHFNVNSLFDEDANRDLKQDTVTLVHGLLGSYPDVFWRATEEELADLVNMATTVKTDGDYRKLLDKYAIRRTDSRFWQFSDKLNQAFKQHNPIEAGWLDYNRLENR